MPDWAFITVTAAKALLAVTHYRLAALDDYTHLLQPRWTDYTPLAVGPVGWRVPNPRWIDPH